MTNLDSILKSRGITLSAKVSIVKAVVFLVVIYKCELNHKEGWALKNWCFWTVVLEKTLESPLDCKEIQPVNQHWIFIERTDAEARILWPPNTKSWLFGKDPDAGKDWGQVEKGATEDERVGWHHYSMDMNLIKLQEIVKGREDWHAAVHEFSKYHTRLSNWITTVYEI